MHKTILIFLIFTSYILSNINALVSITPQVTFLKAIGGDKVDVTLMVPLGSSPHSYEPKPSQMKAVTNADLYFAIDVEFEEVWLSKFQSINPKMKTIDVAYNVEKLSMGSTCHDTHHSHDAHAHEGLDPHIWTSPANVKVIAQNMYEALSKIDAANAPYYKANLDAFLVSVTQTDAQLKEILSSIKGKRSFMVFHPSWGYFAKDYDLEQIAVEVEGKSPKPRALVYLIQDAKEEKVAAIFTQPEFSDASASIIAKALHIPVVKVSPMAANWAENLINMAKTIAGQK